MRLNLGHLPIRGQGPLPLRRVFWLFFAADCLSMDKCVDISTGREIRSGDGIAEDFGHEVPGENGMSRS